MIAEGASSVGRRAARVARELSRLRGVTAELADGVSYAGGGALPMNELATKVIRLEAAGKSAAALAAALRAADPPVIARISKDAVCLDLRTVPPDRIRSLTDAVRQALA
jgi:L-seryl-tRNA(Ser) seleniumtransferase